MKLEVFAACIVMLCASAVAQAQSVEAPAVAIRAAELPSPPVIAGDISDRSYSVLGEVRAGVRKATVFSKAASPEKIYRELWERGRKMHADAVIHASFGSAHLSALSWGQINATGIAIKFNDHATGAGK